MWIIKKKYGIYGESIDIGITQIKQSAEMLCNSLNTYKRNSDSIFFIEVADVPVLDENFAENYKYDWFYSVEVTIDTHELDDVWICSVIDYPDWITGFNIYKPSKVETLYSDNVPVSYQMSGIATIDTSDWPAEYSENEYNKHISDAIIELATDQLINFLKTVDN